MEQTSTERHKSLEVKRRFCILVGIFAFFGLTVLFVVQISGSEQPIVIFKPVFNYFLSKSKTDRVDESLVSEEDSGSRIFAEVTKKSQGDVDLPTLNQIPQHFNEPNFPDLKSDAGQLANSVRILCCVMTSKKRKQNGMAVKQSWGNRCNETIFISEDETDSDLKSVVLPGIEPGPEFSWGRSKVTLDYIWTNYGQRYDWFLKADDTTYVVVENLRHFLNEKSSGSSRPTFYGCQFDTFIYSDAGFVLSREALKVFVEEGLEDKDKCSASVIGREDVEMLKCLKNLNVNLGDSRDEFGRHRFLPYTPERHLIPDQLRKTLWFWQNLYSPHHEGMECCSDTAISFHHIRPYQMIVFHYFIFHLRPCGVSQKGSIGINENEQSKTPDTSPRSTEVKEPRTQTAEARKVTEIPQITNKKMKSASANSSDDAGSFPSHLCHCLTMSPPRSINGMRPSTCSDEATAAGQHQKVISYWLSREGQETSAWKDDLVASLNEMKTFYPGFVARVYTDISLTPGHAACDLICEYPGQLFWCDVTQIPDRELVNIHKMAPRTWRLLPLGDPTVDTFITRDLDRHLSKRERAAVAEWESMHYPYHIMRDHPEQYAALTGALFGVRNDLLTPDASKLLKTTLIKDSKSDEVRDWANSDDALLNRLVYESQRYLVLAHDSYTCARYKEAGDGLTLPFPTKRDDGSYVGQMRGARTKINECPRQCRPSYGQKWVQC